LALKDDEVGRIRRLAAAQAGHNHAIKASSTDHAPIRRHAGYSGSSQRSELKTLAVSADLSGKDLRLDFYQLADFILLHRLANAPESCMSCGLMADNGVNINDKRPR
jgi:hypothetical protein